jgi:hypothetical protein
MTRKSWLTLGPSLLLAVGMVGATFIAGRTAHAGWWVLAGPLLLALSVVGADVLSSRLQGRSSGPSAAALILGGALFLAGWIVALRDPSLVKALIPDLGVAAWITVLLPARGGRKPCREV